MSAPDCACEKYRMSEHSPDVVGDSERLALFVFHPMNLDKKGQVKPSIFSHVHNKGRSIQRDSIASDQELISFSNAFLEAGKDRVWKGVLLGMCGDVRGIKVDDSGKRSVCVYDTANPGNISHAELCQTQYISEADGPELRGELFAAFGSGVIHTPNQFRHGTVWGALNPSLQVRG